jgi:hypothetical protein
MDILVNTTLFILYFYFILLSILGYGIWFCKFCKINIEEISIGTIGLLGIFFLTLISYSTNIFLPHSAEHNLVIFLLGFLLILGPLLSYKIFIKKEIKKTLLVSSLLLIGLFISKNNEDFGYYHFAYIVNLTENKIQFGLANFNSGFGTQSSIFYFTSLLYFPIIKYYLFNSHALLILIFSNIFLLDIFFLNKINNNFIKILSFFSFVFINLLFSRLAEYGTDRAGQIIIFIIVLIFLTNSIKKFFLNNNIKILLILITYIITIKSYFLIYIFLFSLILIQLDNKLKIFFLKNVGLLFILFLFLVLFFVVNIANTGCIIYPLVPTCFSNLFWSVPLDIVKDLNYWFELWSKSGATPNYVVEDRMNYITNFNWVSNWIKNYFFTKGSDTLLSITFINIVFILLFKSSRIDKNNITPKLISLYFFLIFSFIIWFNKHPDLRYGGYVLLALLFFIPTTFYLSKYKIIYKYTNLKVLCLVVIVFISFNTRNYLRIFSEFNRNDPYQFNNFPFFSKEYLKNNIHFDLLNKPEKLMGYNFYSRR